MGGRSSKNKKKDQHPRITQTDRAILELKVQRDKMHQYKKQIAVVMQREHDIAKQLLKEGKKPQALLALKKKKVQAKLLASTDAKINTIEEWVNTVESAERDKLMFEAIKVSKDALEEIHKEMSVEAVEKLLLETADAMETQKQIEEALAGKLDVSDEKSMMEELDALMEAQEASHQKQTQPPSLIFPSVPTEVPVINRPHAAGENVHQQQEQEEEEEEEEEEEDMPPPPPPQLAAA